MGKDESSSKGKKSHSFKPYDVSNSFVQRVTTKVSSYFPQPSWINRLLNSTSNHATIESDEEEVVQIPKRMRAMEKSVEPELINHIREQGCSSKQPVEEEVSPIRRPVNESCVPNRMTHSERLDAVSYRREVTSHRPPHLASKANFSPLNSTFMAASTPALHLKVNGEEVKDSETGSYCSSFTSRENFSKRDSTQMISSSLSHTDQPNESFSRIWNKKLNSSTSSLSSAGRISFDSVTFCNSPFRGRLSAEPKSPAPGMGESEFYAGRTKFGGASSCSDYLLRTRLHSETPVTIKPTESNVPSKSIASSTERILNALKKFSTPNADGGVKSQLVKNDTKRLKQIGKFNTLMIPQMPDLLRIKRREGRRERPRSALSYAAAKASSSSSATFPLPESFRNRLLGVHEVDIVVSKPEATKEDTAAMNYGDNVPLPTFSPFPTFNPPPLKPISRMASSNVQVGAPDKFSFSQPKVVDSHGIDSFNHVISIPPALKFSDPWSPFHKETGQRTDNVVNSLSTENQSSLQTTSKTVHLVNNVEYSNAKLEIPVSGKKERPNEVFKSDNGLDKFKLNANQWVCSQCWVTNSNTVDRCVACEQSRKVDTASKDVFKAKVELKAEKKVPIINSGFGDMFKPPKDSWDCDQCLVNNKASVGICIACSAPKPGVAQPAPLSTMFKHSEGTWECSTCLIRNKSSVVACIACETAKPGAELKQNPMKSSSQFSFSAPATDTTIKKFTFGIPPIPVQNAISTGEKAPAGNSSHPSEETAKGLADSTETVPTGFSFGLPENNTNDSSTAKSSNSTEIKLPVTSWPSIYGNKSTASVQNSCFKPAESSGKSSFGITEPVRSIQFGFSSPVSSSNEVKPILMNPFSSGHNASGKEEMTKDNKSSIEETTVSKNIFGQVALCVDAPKTGFGINNAVNNDRSGTCTAEFSVKPEEKVNVFKFGSPNYQGGNETSPQTKLFNDSKSTQLNNSAVNSSEFSFKSADPNQTSDLSASRFKHINFGSVRPPSGTAMNSFSFNLGSSNHSGTTQVSSPFNLDEGGLGRIKSGTNAPNVFGCLTPMFGGIAAQQPVHTSSAFVFGSANRPAAPFTFSAAQAGGHSGFSFGSVPKKSSLPRNTNVVFDPNTKPNVKFTGGVTPSFTSSSSVEPEIKHPDRIIRKAVRRTAKQ